MMLVHKAEQNFIKILRQDKCYSEMQVLNEFCHMQLSRLSTATITIIGGMHWIRVRWMHLT